MRWKWNNVPIPEAHLIGLIIGTILQKFFPINLFQLPLNGHVIGWPLIAVGIGICVWSVIEAKEMNIANPNKLLTSGPYGLSRNPMYVGWALIHMGISFAANSVWMVILLPIAILYIYFVDIRKEERILNERFGDEFRQYRNKVRRYF